MHVDTKKLSLIEKILHTDREDILEQVRAILELADQTDTFSLTDAQKALLDERLADDRPGEDWEVVKARLRKRA